jgi:hypothetical protein
MTNLTDARKRLFRLRDESLARLRAMFPELVATTDGLAALEAWYLALARASRARVEPAMGFHLGQLAVRTRGMRWIVAGDPFTPGAYEIGVRSKDGLTAVMGVDAICDDWHRTPRRSLAKEFDRMFPVASRKTRAKPRPLATDTMIEQAIREILGRRSTSLVYPRDLELFVEHQLRKQARVKRADVRRVATRLERARVIERVALVRRSGFRYRLAK